MTTRRSATTPTQQHSVPAAVRSNPADDDLDSLDVPAPAAKPKAGKPQRPEIPLPEAVKDAFRRWAWAEVISKSVEARAETEAAEVNKTCFNLWVEALWRHKVVPENPTLKLERNGRPDITAIFQVQEKFTRNSIKIPELEEGQTVQEAMVALLVDLGLEKPDAERLVEEELDLKPVKTLRSFNELIYGHYEAKEWVDATDAEKSVGKKLLDFVKTLAPEERALVLRSEVNTKVKKDFLRRVPSYVHSAEQLKSVFSVLTPVKFASHAKVGLSDTPTERINRLQAEAADIIGNSSK